MAGLQYPVLINILSCARLPHFEITFDKLIYQKDYTKNDNKVEKVYKYISFFTQLCTHYHYNVCSSTKCS